MWTRLLRPVRAQWCVLSRRRFSGGQPGGSLDVVETLACGVLRRDRRSLAKAITLVESNRPHDREQSDRLLERVLRPCSPEDKQKKNKKRARTIRLGISGPPGVGKSTFIESLGKYLISDLQLSVAVLSVDPSSHVTGGSILGDKTRMEWLSRHPDAFLRPSPSRCVLGGIERSTYESMMLCESAGYDVIVVETVGVGQSEVTVRDATDMVVLLVPPAGGDGLQALKKGIVETADLVVINKADGVLADVARHTQIDYMHSLQLLGGMAQGRLWTPKVIRCSSLPVPTGQQQQQEREDNNSEQAPANRKTRKRGPKNSVQNVWSYVQEHHDVMLAAGELERKRAQQGAVWMWRHLEELVVERVRDFVSVHRDRGEDEESEEGRRVFETVQRRLAENVASPRRAAAALLSQFLRYASRHGIDEKAAAQARELEEVEEEEEVGGEETGEAGDESRRQ